MSRRLHNLAKALAVSAGVAVVARADTVCAPGSSPIPDGSGSVTRTIVVQASTQGSTIASVQVTVAATHPWVGDLRLVLRHPSGAEIVLLDRPGLPSTGFPGPWGCGGRDIAATFADSAPTAAESTCSTTAVPVLAGPLQPLTPLSALSGLAPEGEWLLIASDLAAVDAGVLGDVCLTLTLSASCAADLDGNGAIDAADLAIVLGAWGDCADCAADIDGNGTVNGADLAVVLGAWGACR